MSWRRPAAGVALAAAVLVGAELLARALGGAPPPPPALHALPPRPASWFAEEGVNLRAAWQAPDDQLVFAAQPAGPRFAVLGESSVHEGRLGVGRAREFTALTAAATGFEGLNLGAPGLDSADLLAIARALDPWPLHALVLYAGHNDLGNLVMGRRHGGGGSAFLLRVRLLLGRLRLYGLLRGALAGSPHPGAGPAPLSARERARAERGFAANVEALAALAEDRDLPLLLVTPVCDLTRPPEPQPCAEEPCAETLWRRGMALRGRDPTAAAALLAQARDADGVALRASGAIQRALQEVAAAHPGARLLDAQAELPREPGLDVPAARLFSDPLHFSAEGHAAMAALLAPALEALLGAPGSG